MNQNQPILRIKDISVEFGGIKALSGVEINVQKNSITAIIGPNGAGKTTLFNCITGFYKTTAGDIEFYDKQKSHSITRLLNTWFGSSNSVASLGIARTFQNIRLFNEMTVIENLLVAQHNHINKNLFAGIFNLSSFKKSESKALEKALKWLKIMGLTEDGNRLAGELPYGRQRKLEIARAMCTDSRLICLDEPAAGLNHRETKELSELISLLRSEHHITVLVIEHDMSLVMEVSDHIVVLDHGEVIATGTPDEIKTNPKVLAAYLGEEG